MNLPRFSTFLYLFISLSYFITWFVIKFFFSRIESCWRKCQIASFILSCTYLHIFEHMYMFVILFYRENIFLCSSNYSKFHLSKSVIFNVKLRIFLFLSFFFSFYLSFILILIFVVSIFRTILAQQSICWTWWTSTIADRSYFPPLPL